MVRRSSREIESYVQEQELSGLSTVQYCKEKGIKYGTFLLWKRTRIKHEASASNFIHLRCATTSPTFEVRKGSVVVKVPSGFDTNDLKALLECIPC